MNVLDFAAEHPVLAVVLLVVVGVAGGNLLAAPITAWRKWQRPNDCPRCGGTGREP